MKQVRKITATDGEHKIKIVLTQEKPANWEKMKVLDQFDDVARAIIRGLDSEGFSFLKMRIK